MITVKTLSFVQIHEESIDVGLTLNHVKVDSYVCLEIKPRQYLDWQIEEISLDI